MAPKYILEQFLQQELLINITEHEVGVRELGWDEIGDPPPSPSPFYEQQTSGGPPVWKEGRAIQPSVRSWGAGCSFYLSWSPGSQDCALWPICRAGL